MKPGSLIRLLRLATGVSQTDLAERLGVTRAYLSQVENNHKQPSLKLLRAAAQSLGVPLTLLLSEEQEGQPADDIMKSLRDVFAALTVARSKKELPGAQLEDDK